MIREISYVPFANNELSLRSLLEIKFRCSAKALDSKTIFSNNSINSFGKSAAIKALTVVEISSGSCVSDRAVWTT
uniref:Uncharacterized protein n=1 Tax=Romanomermis culicivorax TaxID=13658 RepID=A0A915HHA1_ROMCU